jgi:hypothetical protein
VCPKKAQDARCSEPSSCDRVRLRVVIPHSKRYLSFLVLTFFPQSSLGPRYTCHCGHRISECWEVVPHRGNLRYYSPSSIWHLHEVRMSKPHQSALHFTKLCCTHAGVRQYASFRIPSNHGVASSRSKLSETRTGPNWASPAESNLAIPFSTSPSSQSAFAAPSAQS